VSPGTGVSGLSSNRSGDAATLGHSKAQKMGKFTRESMKGVWAQVTLVGLNLWCNILECC
jgi:hypothetical protein